MANSSFQSDYIRKRNKRFGQLSMTNSTFNLNQSTNWVEVPMAGNVDKIDKGFIVEGQGLKALFSDWIEGDASIYLNSSSARPNTEFCFAINGTARPVIASHGYIRNSSGHNESSITLTDGFFVNEGDVVTLLCRRAANSGTVTSPINSSIMKLSSSPISVSKGPSGTYNFGFESENFGNWVNRGSADWSILSGATGSNNTGANAANSGSFYAYTETSNNAFQESFILETSYFNKLRQLTFSYHMWGSQLGTLTVDYKNKFGTWVNVWSLTGDQGNSWQQANIDFSAEEGIDDAQALRFTHTGATGFEADVCLDDIAVVSV